MTTLSTATSTALDEASSYGASDAWTYLPPPWSLHTISTKSIEDSYPFSTGCYHDPVTQEDDYCSGMVTSTVTITSVFTITPSASPEETNFPTCNRTNGAVGGHRLASLGSEVHETDAVSATGDLEHTEIKMQTSGGEAHLVMVQPIFVVLWFCGILLDVA
jgi:hypothetical protein